ncbi:MAG: hypothetical protein ACM3JG_14875 [Thiohalocapsa sp.]
MKRTAAVAIIWLVTIGLVAVQYKARAQVPWARLGLAIIVGAGGLAFVGKKAEAAITRQPAAPAAPVAPMTQRPFTNPSAPIPQQPAAAPLRTGTLYQNKATGEYCISYVVGACSVCYRYGDQCVADLGKLPIYSENFR